MKLTRVIELTGKYAVCRKCGSDKIGAGAGALNVTEELFQRRCKCGWSVEVKEEFNKI